MKTIAFYSPMKAVLVTLAILATSLIMPHAYAQTTVLTSMAASAEKETATTAKSSMGFQSAAFPVDNTGKVKVIFEDPTGKGASIVIRNRDGRIEHSKNIAYTNRYIGKFDLSPLPDGDYTVEIIPLSKAGFGKQKNSYSFQIQSKSTISRSLTAVNKDQEKKLFTPKHYQVSR